MFQPDPQGPLGPQAPARRHRALAVFLGVAFLAGTLVLGDTLRRQLRRPVHRGQRRHRRRRAQRRRRSTPTRGDRSARHAWPRRRRRSSPTVAAGRRRRRRRAVGRGLRPARRPRRRGHRRQRAAPRWPATGSTTRSSTRTASSRAGAPQADDEVVINRGAAKDGDLHVGDTTDRADARAGHGAHRRHRHLRRRRRPRQDDVHRLHAAGRRSGTSPACRTRSTSILVRGDGGVSQDELVDRLRPVAAAGHRGDHRRRSSTQAEHRRHQRHVPRRASRRSSSCSPASPCSSARSASTTRSRSSSPSGPASRRCCGRSAPAGARCCGRSCSRRSLVGVVASVAGLGRRHRRGRAAEGAVRRLRLRPARRRPDRHGHEHDRAAGGRHRRDRRRQRRARASGRRGCRPLAALRDVAVDRPGAVAACAPSPAPSCSPPASRSPLVGAVGDGRSGPGRPRRARSRIVGVVVLGPVVARAASGVLGAPLRRLRGVTGALARENAMRNPRRTAATASALMVGVAVVTLFTVFAASLKASIDDAVERSFAGDLAVTTGTFGGGASARSWPPTLAALPEVQRRRRPGSGRGPHRRVQDQSVTVADPAALAQVLDLDVKPASLDDLGAERHRRVASAADRHHWTVGSEVPVTFTDGTTDRPARRRRLRRGRPDRRLRAAPRRVGAPRRAGPRLDRLRRPGRRRLGWPRGRPPSSR